MNNSFLRRFFASILIFIMLPSLFNLPGNLVYAKKIAVTDIENDQIRPDSIDTWLQEIAKISDNKFYKFTYNDDGMEYKSYFMRIVLPEGTNTYPRVVYNYNSSGAITFNYEVKGQNDMVISYPIRLDISAKVSDDTYQSILKRQTANNFNVDENNSYGYLLEISESIINVHGGPIQITAQVEVDGKNYTYKSFVVGEGEEITITEISQNNAEDGLLAKFWKWLTDAVGQVKNFLESLYNKVFLAVADGIFSAVCTAVGEPVTIDKVIFGEVGKLSINFWDGTQENSEGQSGTIVGSNTVMSVLSAPVNKWYGVFQSFAILVYLVALLVVGVKIVFASTGDAKAKYKETFTAWLMGVVILFLYPYVMKYTVKINNALIEMINTDFTRKSADEEVYTPTPEISEDKLDSISNSFGEDNFMYSIRGSTFEPDNKKDMMLYVRQLAGNLDKISLTFVYAVLLGELIVVVVVYYKRVFMMAFLITIFPIIAIVHIVEKLAMGNSRALGTWTKEYMVLVFTQAFHAAVYVVVVNAGIEAYLNTDNWLFMLMCVIFLFQGEKILRSIFGMKSSANTIGDLAAAGVAGYGVIKSIPGMFKGKKSENKDDKDLQEAEKKLHQNNTANQAQSTQNDAERANNSSNEAMNAVNNEESNEQNDSQDDEKDPMEDFDKAQAVVIAKALKNRGKARGKRKGLAGAASKAVGTTAKVFGGTLGGLVGTAAGLATGNVAKAAAGAVIGKNFGVGIVKKIGVPIRGMSNIYAGKKLKKEIKSGGMDQEFKEAGFDLAALDSEKQAMFREALAALGGRTTTRGKDAGELKLLKTVDKTKNK